MSIGCRLQEICSHKVASAYQNCETWLLTWACSSKSNGGVTTLKHIKFHVYRFRLYCHIKLQIHTKPRKTPSSKCDPSHTLLHMADCHKARAMPTNSNVHVLLRLLRCAWGIHCEYVHLVELWWHGKAYVEKVPRSDRCFEHLTECKDMVISQNGHALFFLLG